MKKFYLLLPLIATVLFALYYAQFMKQRAESERINAKIRMEAEAKAQAERQKFIEEQDAIAKAAALEKKRIAQEKREAIEAQVKLVKELVKSYDKANVDRDEKAAQFSDLRNEYLDLRDANERSTERLDTLTKENEFLKRYVPTAQANVNRLKNLLLEIDAWEKNQAELAKAAAAAAAAENRNR